MTSMTQPFPRIRTAMRKMLLGGVKWECHFSAKMSDEACVCWYATINVAYHLSLVCWDSQKIANVEIIISISVTINCGLIQNFTPLCIAAQEFPYFAVRVFVNFTPHKAMLDYKNVFNIILPSKISCQYYLLLWSFQTNTFTLIFFVSHVSMITNDTRRTREIKFRIAMTKSAISMKENLFTSILDLNLWTKLVKCYVRSIVLYGADTWRTLRKVYKKYLESFEMWWWRKIDISGTDRVRNEVLHSVKERGRVTGRQGRKRKQLLDDLTLLLLLLH
jgi:hypothetical protein